MIKVTAARALEGHRLWLRFSDCIEGTADLSDLVGKGVFAAWTNPGAFANVSVTDFGAVAWDKDIDLCPDALYLRVTGKSATDLFPSLRETAAHV